MSRSDRYFESQPRYEDVRAVAALEESYKQALRIERAAWEALERVGGPSAERLAAWHDAVAQADAARDVYRGVSAVKAS